MSENLSTPRIAQIGEMSRNLAFILTTCLLTAGQLAAREGTPPPSAQRLVQALGSVHQLVLPPTDRQTELNRAPKVAASSPTRFAVPQRVAISPATDGTWEALPDGRLWRLRVLSSGATDLNFGFTRFWLPEGATLHVVSEGLDYYQGPYTAEDNKPHGQLWTPLVPGEAAVLELFVPATAAAEPKIVLAQVGTGYRDWFKVNSPAVVKDEGACNNDVVCPVGTPWANEIRSVGVYTVDGVWTCSGTLVANTAGDFRAYFLTAAHCDLTVANAPSVVVYWNFQSRTCGTHGPGSLAQNQTGATFRASKADCDFALIELDRLPDPAFQVFYSGWDRSGTPPNGAVGIHHPDCDVKAISFASGTLPIVDSCIDTGKNTHWDVTWHSGVTEPGSSGSGLWDPATHALVGTLSGGDSSCSTPQAPDCYGRFSVGWASGNSPATRLREWLDPLASGVVSIPGANPVPVVSIQPAGSALTWESCYPTNRCPDPGETVTVAFSLKNLGTLNATNVLATLLATNGVVPLSGAQSYGLIVTNGAAVARSFTFLANGVCGGAIAPVLQLSYNVSVQQRVAYALTLGSPSILSTQSFDAVTAPALSSGWTTTPPNAWKTSTAQRDSVPNSAFTTDPSTVSDRQLVGPSFTPRTSTAGIQFRNYYNTESTYDGGVLEISIDGAAFTDILAAGGSFASGGYNGTIDPDYDNPLADRSAWTGDSRGFVTTIVILPASVAGKSVRLRWRLGSDSSTSATGWYIDSIAIWDGYSCCTGSAAPPTLSAPRYTPGGVLQFDVIGTAGYSYAVESSTNFSTWIRLQTNTSPFLFQNTITPLSPTRVFRAVSQP